MNKRQAGLTLPGLILGLAVIGSAAVPGFRCVPVWIEYYAIRSAVAKVAADDQLSRHEVRAAFDKQADINDIESIAGKDLTVTPTDGGGVEVSFGYERRVPLYGNASLVFEFEGSAKR